MASKKKTNRKQKISQETKRDIKAKIKKLKELGVISQKTDLRKVKITNYRRRQISAFKGVLEGSEAFVKLPKVDREQYKRKIASRQFGSFLLIPKEHPNQKTNIVKKSSNNFIEIITPLGKGEMRQIILPYDARDLIELATKMQNDEQLPEYLEPVDQYAFALFGHTHKQGFHSKSELVNHILVNYKHLFDPRNGAKAVEHFVLINYGGGNSIAPDIPESIAGPPMLSEKGQGRHATREYRADWYEKRKRDINNRRARERRRKMNRQDYEEYKRKGNERAKASYARRKQKEFDNAKF